jgi:hypothetical protein
MDVDASVFVDESARIVEPGFRRVARGQGACDEASGTYAHVEVTHPDDSAHTLVSFAIDEGNGVRRPPEFAVPTDGVASLDARALTSSATLVWNDDDGRTRIVGATMHVSDGGDTVGGIRVTRGRLASLPSTNLCTASTAHALDFERDDERLSLAPGESGVLGDLDVTALRARAFQHTGPCPDSQDGTRASWIAIRRQ